VSPEKLDAAFEFETNAAFDDAERAALRLVTEGPTPLATTRSRW